MVVCVCVSLSRPLPHVSVPESTTLRSVLVRATDSRTRQDSLSILNARSQSDDVTLAHPVPLLPLPVCLPRAPFREPQPDNSRSFLFLHLLLQPNSTRLRLHTASPVPCIDSSAARLHRPEPEPEAQASPGQAQGDPLRDEI